MEKGIIFSIMFVVAFVIFFTGCKTQTGKVYYIKDPDGINKIDDNTIAYDPTKVKATITKNAVTFEPVENGYRTETTEPWWPTGYVCDCPGFTEPFECNMEYPDPENPRIIRCPATPCSGNSQCKLHPLRGFYSM